MNPGKINSSNRALGAPANWDPARDGPCGSLPIRDGSEPSGLPSMTSVWEPSEDEIARIVAGEPVFLRVIGYVHPPVALGVGHDE